MVKWNKKDFLINFILRFLFYFYATIIIKSFYCPSNTGQNLTEYLKNSNIDFLPSLITEKKFLNIFDGLTIFVDQYNKSGKFENIYINENY